MHSLPDTKTKNCSWSGKLDDARITALLHWTLSVLWDAFRRPLNPETAPLTFRFSMWSIIRKHLGRLVSGSEPPPLCCGSQFSISCNQFSMGSTIKLKQKGCKTGEAGIPFTRLKQPSFLGLSLCALFNRLWPSLWSTGTGQPKLSKKEPGATGCPWTANSSVPRAWNTAEEKEGGALNAWHKGGRALSLEDQNCPLWWGQTYPQRLWGCGRWVLKRTSPFISSEAKMCFGSFFLIFSCLENKILCVYTEECYFCKGATEDSKEVPVSSSFRKQTHVSGQRGHFQSTQNISTWKRGALPINSASGKIYLFSCSNRNPSFLFFLFQNHPLKNQAETSICRLKSFSIIFKDFQAPLAA